MGSNDFKQTREDYLAQYQERKEKAKRLILAHLDQYGKPNKYLAPQDTTIEGLKGVLGLGSTRSRVIIHELIENEYVETGKKHVPGEDRRKQVYWITDKGRRYL